jgi:hypothetical protein
VVRPALRPLYQPALEIRIPLGMPFLGSPGARGRRASAAAPATAPMPPADALDQNPNTSYQRLLISLIREHPASEVYVTGTFDDWSKSEKLTKTGDYFAKDVTLPRADEKIYYKVRLQMSAQLAAPSTPP